MNNTNNICINTEYEVHENKKWYRTEKERTKPKIVIYTSAWRALNNTPSNLFCLYLQQ